MKAEIITSVNAMMDIKDNWNKLLEESISDTIFLTWEWMYSWAECFVQDERQLFVVCVYNEHDRLLGIAPWYIAKIKVGPWKMRQISFLGNPETASDYLDVFTERGREREVAYFLYDYTFNEVAQLWDCMNLQDVRAESLFLLNFVNKHYSHGRHLEMSRGSFCPIIYLPKKEEEFYSQISSSRSKRFRQDLRTLKKTGVVEVKTCVDEGLGGAIDDFFMLYKEKTNWDGKDLHRFMKKLATNLDKRTCLQIDFLMANKNCVGGLLHLRYGNSLSLYLMGVDKTYNPRISIGNLLIGMCVGRAIQDNVEMYDFLKGYEEYKFYWTNTGRVSQSLFVGQRKILPILYDIKQMGKNVLKTILR